MIEKYLDILACPKTGNKLIVERGSELIHVENCENLHYHWHDGILDFLPGLKDRVSSSYDATSSLYDGYITSSNLLWELVCQFVWGFGRNDPSIEKVLSFIPDDFSGTLLDVPVGTGVFTFEKYRKMKNARLIVLDYSMGMLQKARQVYQEQGIDNVLYIRGDAGSLPLLDHAVDFCLTMNGLHAFPQKQLALDEMHRVLKPGAQLAGCFYVSKQRRLTDIIIKNILAPGGAFTAPFYSRDEATTLLKKGFDIRDQSNLNSIFCFNSCRSKSSAVN